MRRLSAPILLLAATALAAQTAKRSVVSVDPTQQAYQLTRNGKPYFIRGAGGREHLEELVKAGGNSIRTWGADDLESLLDEAHRLGLTVTVGLWLGHERHGFNYQDDKAIVEQLEKARDNILRYKDRPALLMWGVGNEIEGDGGNPAV